jgi:hypothetical protein
MNTLYYFHDMSNAETAFTYNNFPLDIERVSERATQVVAVNYAIGEQNSKFHDSLGAIGSPEFRAIAQHELVDDQRSTLDQREALADGIPYGALGPIR